MGESEKLKIVWVDINELKPSEYNPRKWSKKQEKDLKESIEKYGVVDPLIVNSAPNRKNIIIGGHFRYYILKQLGYKKVPVIYINISDVNKEKELNLRLNKNLGDWDWEKLKRFDKDFLKTIGFKTAEIRRIFEIEKVYTLDISSPVYEPKGLNIKLKDCYDDIKLFKLLNKIKKANIKDKELRRFLEYAAYRFTKFNFMYIAELYTKQPPEIQRLFEDLALVIVDINNAIQNNWVELVDRLYKLTDGGI